MKKRIALSAVVALFAGLLAAAPASAVSSAAVIADAADYVAVGGTATTAMSFVTSANNDTATVTLTVPAGSALTRADADGVGTPLWAATDSDSTWVAGTGVITDVDSADDSTGTLTLKPDVFGTYTITLTAGASTDTYYVYAGANTPFSTTVAQTDTGDRTSTMTATQIAGPGSYVAITAGVNTVDKAFPDVRYVQVTGSTFINTTDGATNLNATAQDGTAWAFNGTSVQTSTIAYAPADGSIASDQLWIATPAAGTVTVKLIDRTVTGGVGVETTLQTLTITVAGAPADAAFNNAVVSDITGFGTGTKDDGDGTVYAPKGLPSTPATGATFTVSQWADEAKTTLTGLTSTKAVEVSVAGVGLLTATGLATPTTYISVAAGKYTNPSTFTIWNDGRAGVATVTVKIDGKVAATRKVTFFGAVASLSATVVKNYIGDGAGAWTDVVAVTAKDADGVLVPGATITAKTTDIGVTGTMVDQMAALTWNPGVYHLSATAAAGETGAYTFTFTSGTITTTAVVNVSNIAVKTATLTLDKATYAPGEKATLTLTLKDSNGLPVPDIDGTEGNLGGILAGGAPWLAAATATDQGLIASSGITSDLFKGGRVKTKNGVATVTFYMPLVSGPVLITGKTNPATSVASVALSASATVSQSADAAAQAAAIAALQTSVAALQTTVASLVASITAQIKAINSALRKIAAKMKVKL